MRWRVSSTERDKMLRVMPHAVKKISGCDAAARPPPSPHSFPHSPGISASSPSRNRTLKSTLRIRHSQRRHPVNLISHRPWMLTRENPRPSFGLSSCCSEFGLYDAAVRLTDLALRELVEEAKTRIGGKATTNIQFHFCGETLKSYGVHSALLCGCLSGLYSQGFCCGLQDQHRISSDP